MRKTKERPLRDLPIVEVRWVDHVTFQGWRSRANARELQVPECRDVGRIIHQTEDTITLAAIIADDGDVNGVMLIPSPWVRGIRRLR